MAKLAPDGSELVYLTDGQGGVYSPPSPMLAAGENHIGEVGGRTAICVGSFTRVADTNAYVSGDLMAQSTTATMCQPVQIILGRNGLQSAGQAATGMIRRLRLRKSGTSITTASVRVHLYSVANIVHANGDNGAWSTNQMQYYLGSLDGTFDRAFTDGAVADALPTNGTEINFVAPVVYAVMEARSAYTPASAEVFMYQFEVLQN